MSTEGRRSPHFADFCLVRQSNEIAHDRRTLAPGIPAHAVHRFIKTIG